MCGFKDMLLCKKTDVKYYLNFTKIFLKVEFNYKKNRDYKKNTEVTAPNLDGKIQLFTFLCKELKRDITN